jgi:hypothetical protein
MSRNAMFINRLSVAILNVVRLSDGAPEGGGRGHNLSPLVLLNVKSVIKPLLFRMSWGQCYKTF